MHVLVRVVVRGSVVDLLPRFPLPILFWFLLALVGPVFERNPPAYVHLAAQLSPSEAHGVGSARLHQDVSVGDLDDFAGYVRANLARVRDPQLCLCVLRLSGLGGADGC